MFNISERSISYVFTIFLSFCLILTLFSNHASFTINGKSVNDDAHARTFRARQLHDSASAHPPSRIDRRYIQSESDVAGLTNLTLARRDFTCGPGSPCVNGACCGAGGYCGYGKLPMCCQLRSMLTASRRDVLWSRLPVEL